MSASRDQKNELKTGQSVPPTAAATGTVNGAAVDGKGFHALTFSASLGAGGAATMKIQEADSDGGPWTDADDANDVLGSQGVDLVQSDTVTLGYVGNKKFARAVVIFSSDGDLSVTHIQGKPDISPV